MWWIKYLIGVSFLYFFQCPTQITELALTSDMIKAWSPVEEILETETCNDNLSYVPDTTLAYADNLKHIRMNFHFMNSKDWQSNYHGEAAIKYAKELVYYANEKLYKNKKMHLPEGNDTPVYYPRYRYDLEENGVFFHADEDLGFYVNEGKRNNYSRDVINKYSVGEDSVLNVFYMIHHPDSVKSKTYSASSSGIALGKSIKLGTVYDPSDPPWKHASLLNHEVGHVLGLSHSWRKQDGCDDTPTHPNCWAPTESGKCKGPTSNNMMDYNSNQHAITPCQIGKMRKNMAKLGSRQRDLLKRKWCELDEKRNVVIDKAVHFKGAKDLQGNIIIRNGGELRVSCRLSMPADSEILVEPGGSLILDGAYLHNDCGREWKGIILTKDRNMGTVYQAGEVKIENVKGHLSEDE